MNTQLLLASSFTPPRFTGSRPEKSGIPTSDKGSSESGAAPATYALPGWFLKSTHSPLGESTNLRLAGIANGPGTFLRSIIWE